MDERLRALVADLSDPVRGDQASVQIAAAAEKAYPALIEGLRLGNHEVKMTCVAMLGQIWLEHEAPDESVVKALVGALGDPDVDGDVATLLGGLGQRSAVPGLIAALELSDSLRTYVISALGELADDRAVDALLQLPRDPDWCARDTLCIALRKIGSIKAVPTLIRFLSDDNRAVRISAIVALWHIGDRSAVPWIEICLNDPDVMVQRTAHEALRYLPSEPPSS